MTSDRARPAGAARAAMVLKPQEAGAYADCVLGLGDDAAVFRWFRRLLILSPEIDGAVFRKALKAAGGVEADVLARLANAAKRQDVAILPFVGAALLVTGRVGAAGPSRPRAMFDGEADNFGQMVGMLSGRSLPGSIPEAFHVVMLMLHTGRVLKSAGYFDLSDRVGLMTSVVLRLVRRQLYQSEFRVFSHHWIFAIGHMVILSFLIKGQEAGMLDFHQTKVWSGKAANWFLWRCLTEMSPGLQMIRRGSTFADNHSSGSLEWIDGRYVDCFNACGVIADQAGDADGGILARPAPSHPILRDYFAAVGIDTPDRVVTVHCREGGFRLNGQHDLRNADIASYRTALRHLVAQGYRAIRLGDPSMTPLPPMDGVVDYAVSALKSEELDILLPGIARFHLGSSSGMSLVPLLFGTPCLFLNWHPFDLLPWGRRNWTVLKPLESLGDRRRIVDRRTYAFLGRIRERGLLNAFGYDAPALEADEIARAVREFVDALDAEAAGPPKCGPNRGRVLVADGHGGLTELS